MARPAGHTHQTRRRGCVADQGAARSRCWKATLEPPACVRRSELRCRRSTAVGPDRPPRLSTPPRRGAARDVAGLVGHFHSLPAFSGLQTLDPGCTVTTQGHEPSAQCPVFGPRHVKASWVLIGIFIIVASFLAGFERQAAHTLELVGGCGRGQKGTLFSSLYPAFSPKEGCQDAVEVALAPKGRGGGSAPCL